MCLLIFVLGCNENLSVWVPPELKSVSNISVDCLLVVWCSFAEKRSKPSFFIRIESVDTNKWNVDMRQQSRRNRRNIYTSKLYIENPFYCFDAPFFPPLHMCREYLIAWLSSVASPLANRSYCRFFFFLVSQNTRTFWCIFNYFILNASQRPVSICKNLSSLRGAFCWYLVDDTLSFCGRTRTQNRTQIDW